MSVSQTRMVGPAAISRQQALALGYGHGTSNGSVFDGISPFVSQLCEIGAHVTFTDPTPFAVFGREARAYELLRVLPASRRNRVHREVFRAAYRLMRPLPADLDRWLGMLDTASAGLPLSADDQAWIEGHADSAWRQRNTPAGRRALAAGHALRGMRYGTEARLSRALVELFGSAGPDEAAAARWLCRVGSVIQVSADGAYAEVSP
ncbi:hypothetical protein [Jiangella asiatica]|uniref:Uncharacterized protein n=1 Tax=Jiangella asiatica TaxID=2530372 RepID=A0A4R5CS39_9ACTN|nr:hypothetical protein [Jiangella asiatica]TDE03382.1 hypothetical protein E1269_20290 [Jiangella asiatica]